MKKINDMKYFMEAPMHAFPRYSAILLALAFSIPAFAQVMANPYARTAFLVFGISLQL